MTDSYDAPEPHPEASPDPGAQEADRLIAAALGDHLRMPAPARLRAQLARTHLAPKRRWPGWVTSAALGAAAAAAALTLFVRPPDVAGSLADEAVGDHLRIIGAAHPLEVASTNIHNVKPWFTGKLEFVPPVGFVGDDEFQLRGGELAVFHGHKAAAFVYQIRLHTISLLVFPDATGQPRREATLRGFHVLSWSTGGLGMALVSDVAWEDLRALEGRLR